MGKCYFAGQSEARVGGATRALSRDEKACAGQSEARVGGATRALSRDEKACYRLTKSIRIEPYQIQFLPIPVPKNPGETLLVYSQPKINPDSLPFLTKVDDSNNVYLPFINNTIGVKEVKQGT